MKFERTVKQEVDVATLHASIGVRYWEDASVNGIDEDDENTTMPLIRDGDGLQHMAGHVAAAVAWPVWIIWAAVDMSRKGDDDE